MAAAFHLSRYDTVGEIRYMTRAGGYVMCRRPRCMPFVLSEKEWMRLPLEALPDGSLYPSVCGNGIVWRDPLEKLRRRSPVRKED